MSELEVHLFRSYTHLSRSLTRTSFLKYGRVPRFNNPRLLTDSKFRTFGINHIHESQDGSSYVFAAEEGFGEITIPRCSLNWIERKQVFVPGNPPVLKQKLPKFYQVVRYRDLYICESPQYLDWKFFLGPLDATKRIVGRLIKERQNDKYRNYGWAERQNQQQQNKNQIELTPPESRNSDFKIQGDTLYYINTDNRYLKSLNLAKLYHHIVNSSDKQLSDKDYLLPQTTIDQDVSLFLVLKDNRLLYIKKNTLLDRDDDDFQIKTAHVNTDADMKAHNDHLFLVTNGASDRRNCFYRICLYSLKSKKEVDSMQYGYRFDNQSSMPAPREKACPNRLYLFRNRHLLHGLITFRGLFLAVFAFGFGRLVNVGRIKLIHEHIPNLRGIVQSSRNPNIFYLYDNDSIFSLKLKI